jgi:hypothetical protein
MMRGLLAALVIKPVDVDRVSVNTGVLGEQVGVDGVVVMHSVNVE